jgi:hypothetical protein
MKVLVALGGNAIKQVYGHRPEVSIPQKEKRFPNDFNNRLTRM